MPTQQFFSYITYFEALFGIAPMDGSFFGVVSTLFSTLGSNKSFFGNVTLFSTLEFELFALVLVFSLCVSIFRLTLTLSDNVCVELPLSCGTVLFNLVTLFVTLSTLFSILDCLPLGGPFSVTLGGLTAKPTK